MYRRIVLSSSAPTSGGIVVVYHVRGAILLSQYRRYYGKYIASISNNQMNFPIVFDDSVRLTVTVSINDRMTYEFVLEVDENQPIIETVEYTASQNIDVAVYNADGVIVCRNNAAISAGSAPEQTDAPGEMTSEPIEGPGEMTSEPIDGSGEML